MRKPAAVLFAILVGGLIWFFFQHFQVEGVDAVRVVPRDPNMDTEYRDDPARTTPYAMRAASREPSWLGSRLSSPAASGRDTIRVASFHLESFGQAHVTKHHVLDLVARIVRRFDVVALQGITSPSDDVVPRLVDLLNRTGRQYDYVVGPRLGREGLTQQHAFVFDRETLLVDRDELYTVGDPDDLLLREPLVAWFRARGPAQDEAFTFTLVNVLTDARRNDQELNVLDNVFVEVQNDGRGEDDVIMLGDLNADPRELGELGQMSGLIWAVRGVPTNVEGTRQTQHIMFQRGATDEFTGRWGVCDFLREFNLSVEGARETSPHLPVWAEFAKYEGGDQGRVASRGAKSVP